MKLIGPLWLALRLPLLILGVFVVGIAAGLSQQDYVLVVTLILTTVLPLALQRAPAAWRGAQMALIARGCSAVLALAGLYFTGQLDHFDAGKVALYIGAYVALTGTFFDLFKDPWHLADPPAPKGPIMPSLMPPAKA